MAGNLVDSRNVKECQRRAFPSQAGAGGERRGGPQCRHHGAADGRDHRLRSVGAAPAAAGRDGQPARHRFVVGGVDVDPAGHWLLHPKPLRHSSERAAAGPGADQQCGADAGFRSPAGAELAFAAGHHRQRRDPGRRAADRGRFSVRLAVGWQGARGAARAGAGYGAAQHLGCAGGGQRQFQRSQRVGDVHGWRAADAGRPDAHCW